MDQKLLLDIRTYGQRFANSPNEKFLLMILGSQAKLENDNRGVNVRRGLRTRCEMGLRPGVAPTGYFNEKRTDKKCHAVVDPVRAPIIKQMFEKVANEKWSGRKLYHWLKFTINFKSKGNKNLSLSNIYIILQNTFYYGRFEYGGNWYGTQKSEIPGSKDLIWKIDPSMAGKAKNLYPECKIIYITTDDQTILKRLKQRGLSEEEINKRLTDDQKFWDLYQNNYQYLVENVPENLSLAVNEICKIIDASK